MMWLNWSVATINATLQLLDIYRLGTVFAENRESALFAMVVWALWTRRNNLRMGKKAETLAHLV